MFEILLFLLTAFLSVVQTHMVWWDTYWIRFACVDFIFVRRTMSDWVIPHLDDSLAFIRVLRYLLLRFEWHFAGDIFAWCSLLRLRLTVCLRSHFLVIYQSVANCFFQLSLTFSCPEVLGRIDFLPGFRRMFFLPVFHSLMRATPSLNWTTRCCAHTSVLTWDPSKGLGTNLPVKMLYRSHLLVCPWNCSDLGRFRRLSSLLLGG